MQGIPGVLASRRTWWSWHAISTGATSLTSSLLSVLLAPLVCLTFHYCMVALRFACCLGYCHQLCLLEPAETHWKHWFWRWRWVAIHKARLTPPVQDIAWAHYRPNSADVSPQKIGVGDVRPSRVLRLLGIPHAAAYTTDSIRHKALNGMAQLRSQFNMSLEWNLRYVLVLG